MPTKLKHTDDANVLPGDLVKSLYRNGTRHKIYVTDSGLRAFTFRSITEESMIEIGDVLFVVTRINPGSRMAAGLHGAYVMSPMTIGWIAIGYESHNVIEFLEPGVLNTDDEQVTF